MSAHDKDLEKLNGMSEITALGMIRDDIQDLKAVLREHQAETKAEFTRIRDKIDHLNVQQASESKTSAVAIKSLETEHKNAAARVGAVAGFIGAIVVTAFGALVRWFMGGGAGGGA